MTDPFPPRLVANAQVRHFDLTGYLFLWHQNNPALVTLSGSDDFFLMVFSTIEKLRAQVEAIDLPFEKIKRIDQPIEMFESIPQRIGDHRLRIIVDPYVTPEGNTRFFEVMRDPGD